MSAVLDFPTLADDHVAITPIVPEDVAEIREGRAVVNLTRTEAGLTALRVDLAGKKYDLTTVKGNDAARADRKRCVDLRTALEKQRKKLKGPALEFGRLIDAEAARITAEITKLESPIDAAIKADEDRREAERQERARLEAERIAGLKGQADTLMRVWLERCAEPDMTAERIGKGIEKFMSLEAPADLADVADYWSAQQSITLGRMQTMQADLARREEDARLAAERAELERQRAELEAQQAAARAELARLEQERKAAEEAAKFAAFASSMDAAIEHAQRTDEIVAVAEPDIQEQEFPEQRFPNEAPAFDLTPEPTDLLGDTATTTEQTTEQAARALLDHIAEAFTGRFPSDPKPGRAWFATLKTLACNLNDTI